MYKQDSRIAFYYEKNYNLLYFKVYNLPQGDKATRSTFSKKKTSPPPINCTNVALYDIATDSTSYLFDTSSERKIQLFLFEQAYDFEHQKLLFNSNIGNIINNEELPHTEPKDKLLFLLEDTAQKKIEFWTSDKKGNGLEMIKAIPWNLTWKLDIKNKKIIFIEALHNAINIESIDW